jgi:hypothetical protein
MTMKTDLDARELMIYYKNAISSKNNKVKDESLELKHYHK